MLEWDRIKQLISIAGWLWFSLPLLSFAGLSQADTVCAQVKIEIQQELTLERQAFDAMMRISNGLDTLPIENVDVEVSFEDEEGQSVQASSDPDNTTAKFFIRIDSMDNISDVNGQGSVAPSSAAEIHWLIIPAAGAAEDMPSGKLYYVGATLSYTLGGERESVTVTPDFIRDDITNYFIVAFSYHCLPGFIQKLGYNPINIIECVDASSFSLVPNIPLDCTNEANPCHPSTGNKSQIEIDIASAKSFGISFKRFYSSLGDHNSANNYASRWRHSYERSLNEGIRTIPPDVLPQADQSRFYVTPEEARNYGWQKLSGTVYNGALSTATATLLSDQDCRITCNGKTVAIFLICHHAGGAEKTQFSYNTDGTTTIIDAIGVVRTYNFDVIGGALRVTNIKGDRCTTCGIKSYTYDSNGFIVSKIDWNDSTTTYTRDDHGRELSRTEASGTPQARTITTTWDTTHNKSLTVTEPEKITEYTYDAEGRLLSEQMSNI
jgi:YD repeat-containing protein